MGATGKMGLDCQHFQTPIAQLNLINWPAKLINSERIVLLSNLMGDNNGETELTGDVAVEPEEELIARHRREKKDLQAKIQALKKTATKGDKKKKKDVAEEIAKIEKELTEKHEV